MMKLYYIKNVGCDDETQGIAELDDRELDVFLTVIRNLNKNSHYGCMPTISVREADWCMFKEWCEDEHCDYEKLYFNDKIYAFWGNCYQHLGPNLL